MKDKDEYIRGLRAAIKEVALLRTSSDAQFRLVMGELSAQDLRNIRAALSLAEHNISKQKYLTRSK